MGCRHVTRVSAAVNGFMGIGVPNRVYFSNDSPVTRCQIAEHAIMIPAWYSAFIGSGISALSDSADLYRPINSAFHLLSGRLIFRSSTVMNCPNRAMVSPMLMIPKSVSG